MKNQVQVRQDRKPGKTAGQASVVGFRLAEPFPEKYAEAGDIVAVDTEPPKPGDFVAIRRADGGVKVAVMPGEGKPDGLIGRAVSLTIKVRRL